MPTEPRVIDSRVVQHGHNKLYLWIVWLIIMVISVGYTALSFISFQKILRVYRRDDNGVESNVLWSVLAASFIGPASVVAFFFFGTFVLLRKTMSETGLSYSYGALHLSSFWLAIVALMSAVSLHGQRDLIETCWEDAEAAPEEFCGTVANVPWSTSDTSLVTSTYIFAYILVFGYLVLFVVLALLRDAAKKLYVGQSVEAAAAQEGVTASESGSKKKSKTGSKPGTKADVKDGETAPSRTLSSLSGAEDTAAAKDEAAKDDAAEDRLPAV